MKGGGKMEERPRFAGQSNPVDIATSGSKVGEGIPEGVNSGDSYVKWDNKYMRIERTNELTVNGTVGPVNPDGYSIDKDPYINWSNPHLKVERLKDRY